MELRNRQIRRQSPTRPSRRVAALLIYGACLSTVLALDPARTVFQYSCQTWTRHSGLSANGINAITQTRDGFIWFGTQKGLVRYDGVEFKILTLPSSRLFEHRGISSLSGAGNDDLWFGIPNGAFGFYRADTGFGALTNQAWVTPGMNVSALRAARDGSLWVNSASGLMRWTGKSNAVQFLDAPNAECLAMFEDSTGRVMLSLLGQGVFYYDGSRMIPFPDPDLTNKNTFVFGIGEDMEGRFWMAAQAGVRVYDRQLRLLPSPPIGPKCLCVLADREGTVWIGSDGDGLFCWRNGEVSNFRKMDGLADDHVTALCEDREGNLWVGTRGGANLLSDVKLPLYSPPGANQSAAFHSVCLAATGGIWAGSGSGLFRFDGMRFTQYTTEAGLSSSWVKQVFEASDGDLYLANGLQEIEIVRDGKVVARHNCSKWQDGFAEDRQGVVVGLGDGLFRVSRSGLSPYRYAGAAPASGWIRNVSATRDGAILLATVSGVFRVKEGSWDRISVDNGLPANDVLWVSEDSNGVLWVGTVGGIARIQGMQVDSWTHDNGLFDNYVRAIIPDDKGWIWFHSAAGIFRVRQDSFILNGFRAEKLNCEAFDGLDSVKTLETADVEYSACKTRDGRIWIPSPEGLILVDPNHLTTAAGQPPVHVESIRVNGKSWSHASTFIVPPGRGELEVQYTAPTFLAPRKQQFRYKLEGYESAWKPVGTRRSAFFTNLKPGKYKFIVEACTANGLSSGEADSFEFNLLPFFYQTTWFYFLCAGVVLTALASIYSWRVRFLTLRQRQMQATQERLETEVGHRTAELRERTVLLENEIEDRKRVQQEIERVHRKLLEASRVAGMAEVATGVLHNVGNVLNSVNVSTHVLTERIRKSKVSSVGRVVELLKAHQADLGSFLSTDPKGKQLPGFLEGLSTHLNREQAEALQELSVLHKHVEHIKQVVAMQQGYAKTAGVTTAEDVVQLAEDALSMNESGLEKHHIALVRDYQPSLPRITIDRHKVIQILLNLVRNAKYACDEGGGEEKRVVLRIRQDQQQVTISVADNGIGIPAENLDRIFSHGFTTRKNGHGFGLHSSALAAKEMGGGLYVTSEGRGKGAEFRLELPIQPPASLAVQSGGFGPVTARKGN